ncbi:MAG TPA: 50S ribosomal protein L18 [Phycisphaerae bacterium]|mgnify:CR=1 FL=1|nr:50S ribosomal protein L18 [Phycisphaerae bacterium]
MRQQMIKLKRLSRRVRRVRKKVSGSAERPRLAVTRSNRNISAQLIDDLTGRTLCAVTTESAEVRAQAAYGGNQKAAALAGKLLGEKALKLGVQQAAFDRRGRRYHGRIKALADAAREAGLKF